MDIYHVIDNVKFKDEKMVPAIRRTGLSVSMLLKYFKFLLTCFFSIKFIFHLDKIQL